MDQIDVTIWNGRIKLMTCTVTGTKKYIEKIKSERGIFDVAGTDIRLSHFEQASAFCKKFGIQ